MKFMPIFWLLLMLAYDRLVGEIENITNFYIKTAFKIANEQAFIFFIKYSVE